MDKKPEYTGGIRVELQQGTGEAVAVDALVQDLLHGKSDAALKDLHEPHSETDES